jgi:hypothetical protein
MSRYLALDKDSGDLILGDSGGVERVEDGRFTIQQVRSKLRTGKGEWLLNTGLGWIGRQELSRNFDPFDIETRARRIIQSTIGVKAVLSISSSLAGRELFVTFRAATAYGIIDLTVPWKGAL